MNSEVLQKSIQALTQKLKVLLEHYRKQQDTLQHLQEENAQLTQKASSSMPTANFSNSSENSTITDKKAHIRTLGNSIDGYIRDIDESIAYLERLQ